MSGKTCSRVLAFESAITLFIAAVIDGEVVVLDEQANRNSNHFSIPTPETEAMTFYYAFDLMMLNGKDLRLQPLTRRRQALQQILKHTGDPIRFSQSFEGDPKQLVALIKQQGLEGIVAKEVNSSYESGKRSGKWQKFKTYQEVELPIYGFIPEGRGGLEAVVLGKVEAGEINYVACMEVRLPLQETRKLRSKLEKLITAHQPFAEIPEGKPGNSWSSGMTKKEQKKAVWVKPGLKAEVVFLEWTRGGYLRHAQLRKIL